jgi:nucleotide-binding universal stress UspA family protein
MQKVKADGRPIASLLSSIAKDCAADLLVMGAYGRGPLREMVFGGCTQSVLEHADLPVFLLH